MENQIDTQISRLLTTNEVAELLNISRAMVGKLARGGYIPRIQIGSCVRFHPIDVQDKIDKLRQGGGWTRILL